MATLSYLSCPHFPGNRQRRFPGKWGRVEGGSLVAATCIPDRDKPRRRKSGLTIKTNGIYRLIKLDDLRAQRKNSIEQRVI